MRGERFFPDLCPLTSVLLSLIMDKLILEDGEYITEFPDKKIRAEKANNPYLIASPIPGVIIEVKKKETDAVSSGETIIILEAMKMENEIISEVKGKIEKIFVKVGNKVGKNDILVKVKE